jgi:Tfp pilus assembly protein PilN
MIQFNLLPDVKLQYIKARRTQRLVIGISTLLIAASLFVFVVLIGTVDILQKKNLSDLNRDVKSYSSQLKNTPNLNKILTVQNQLQALAALHDGKPAASRLFDDLRRVTPADASISQLQVGFPSAPGGTLTTASTGATLVITGQAKSLDVINAFADTLKFTTYTKNGGPATPAFSQVVLTQFSRSASGSSYTINTLYDPEIFNIKDNISLNVPHIISTRSVTEQPTDLFQSTNGAKK